MLTRQDVAKLTLFGVAFVAVFILAGIIIVVVGSMEHGFWPFW